MTPTIIYICSKGLYGDESLVVVKSQLKYKHPGGSSQKSQDRKKNAKFCQMCRFSSLSLLITIAWCIASSCQKVKRSIRNLSLTNASIELIAFGSQCFCPKTYVPQPPYPPGLTPCDFFLCSKLKIRINERRFARIDEIE